MTMRATLMATSTTVSPRKNRNRRSQLRTTEVEMVLPVMRMCASALTTLKEEPKPKLGCNDGPPDIADYHDYGSTKEDPDSKSTDIFYHPLKEEPDLELGDGDRDSADVNGCCGYGTPKIELEPELGTADGGGGNGGADYASNVGVDTIDCYYDYGATKEEPSSPLRMADDDCYYDRDPPKEEPELELPAMGSDAVVNGGRDVGYNCSHCRISLSTPEFKVEHELRCMVQMKQKELESQITKLYHCGYCRCPFINEEFKEQHQQKYCRKRPVVKRKDSSGTYFECDKCKFVTKFKNDLACHLLTHNKTNAKWFTCTQCSYKTVRKQDMTTHMKIHGNTFNCCCPICGKSFRTKRGLDDHLLRQHFDGSDEVSKLITSKVYTCDICDQFRTASKTSFNVHLTITHLKGVGCQKYECAHCPYSTFYKGDLTQHSKRHAEQKDYRCTVCKKQFIRKPGLDSHVLSNHADNEDLVKTITSKIHRCELCPFKTVVPTNLKWHVQSKHL